MPRYNLLFSLLTLVFTAPLAQFDLANYLGGWSGELPRVDAFQFQFRLIRESNDQYSLLTVGTSQRHRTTLEKSDQGIFTGIINGELPIRIDPSGPHPVGILQSGNHLSCLAFNPISADEFTATWNLLLAEQMDPTFYLALEEASNGNGQYFASTFFQAPVAHYMWGQQFQKTPSGFTFRDVRSELKFSGTLLADQQIKLRMGLLGEQIEFNLNRLDFNQWHIRESDYPIVEVNPLGAATDPNVERLLQDVQSDSIVGTHSVLLWQEGGMNMEIYFDGFSANVPHDTRSLTKSFASALVGLAIQEGLIHEATTLHEVLAEKFPDVDWSNGKDQITVSDLLHMSSGLDAIDFGIRRISVATEDIYQNQSDWTDFILRAPMVNPPGKEAYYGSANPHLIGAILGEILGDRLPFFIYRQLMAPLGIKHFRMQTDHGTQPYFGGGWYFTSQELLHFGQMYLNDGRFGDTQILTADWARQSMQAQLPLLNTNKKNRYGYLFWHDTYTLPDGQKVASVEARGAGGQYLIMIPELRAAAVITSGNYRNGRAFQPEQIFEDYLLPMIAK